MSSRGLWIALFATMILGWTTLAYLAGTDEFGRSTLEVLIQSMGVSLFRGLLLVIPLVALVSVLAASSEVYAHRRSALGVQFMMDAVESVPAYLWVLAAVSASSQFPALAGMVAMGIALAPLAYATMKNLFAEIMRQPFVVASVVSGMPRREILLCHVFPHSVSPSLALVLNLLGASVAIYGSLGAFGFVNRQTLDLGTLLLRGRELAPLDPSLLLLTLGAFCILYVVLTSSSRLLIVASRFTGKAVDEGSSHLIWLREAK